METIAVPVLSASVGLFGALTLTSIVAAIIIVHTCACRKKSKGRNIYYYIYVYIYHWRRNDLYFGGLIQYHVLFMCSGIT